MTRSELVKQIFDKKTFLCIGLDTDIDKVPKHLSVEEDAVFQFNKAIIDATKDLCVAYKINTAFYEAEGLKGWKALEDTVNYIPDTHLIIADAKRGDIGNTSAMYAKAFFEKLHFDALTVAPYMGEDSIMPFLQYKNKWTIILGLTSNTGAKDFELQQIIQKTTAGIETAELALDVASAKTEFLYETVLRTAATWGTEENLMFVVGATQSQQLINIRNIVPNHFLLVPGVGAQGGSLKEISETTLIKDCGLLVNVSRAIIYASAEHDFAERAASVSKQYQQEMQQYLLNI
jgi:orotidine-5'-phosphate decarboxylase